MNPLLDFSGLPRFADFKPEFVGPAVSQLLSEVRAVTEKVTAEQDEPTWDSFVVPLDDSIERLRRAWGQVAHLNAVMNSPQLREVYNENLPQVTQLFTELAQNESLYLRYKTLQASTHFGDLSEAQRKFIENELRDFRLGGADLAANSKAEFKENAQQLAKLSSRFNDNLLDETNDFELIVADESDLAGIPEDVIDAARQTAENEGKSGWKFTLHAPSYLPVMQYADNRSLREQIYRAFVTRASEYGSPEHDNTSLITEILKLRRRQAQLLGYADYAQVSLEPKMAQSAQQVLKFLDDFAARAKPYAQHDLEELRSFAASELGLKSLEAWDLAYASEKLRVSRFAFSDQEVKQYFPEPKVLEGMFRVVQTLYGIKIAEDEAPRWNEDVRFYSIRHPNGELVGQFYLDLHARSTKRGGAWMDDAITRRKKNDGIQTPVAYLNCNFSSPVGDKPALLTHDEVITLFHEFGHGLHHLLTRVDVLGVSGINGVEWDAVELPSQFMENYCWEWNVLKDMTQHVESGAALPKEMFDKMHAAKNFNVGMQTVRQIEFSLFDMMIHHGYDPDGPVTPMQVLARVRDQVAVVIPPAYNRFPNSFSHIFGGGYAAGYYSYKWAEVLSADAFSAFEEGGVLNQEVGKRFRDEILAKGGSRPALKSFVAFRGREPTIDALLRHSGMTNESVVERA
ncbi:MAG: M3 family metallopeptidase [Betaproteobacteria bacterium]|nr:MAG: M3 family metallopeptidase [Betaproteobacteria bacterium]